jgi:hypothetical protein
MQRRRSPTPGRDISGGPPGDHRAGLNLPEPWPPRPGGIAGRGQQQRRPGDDDRDAFSK